MDGLPKLAQVGPGKHITKGLSPSVIMALVLPMLFIATYRILVVIARQTQKHVVKVETKMGTGYPQGKVLGHQENKN